MMNTFPPSNLSISASLLYTEALKRNIECHIFDEYTLLMEKNGKKWYTRGSRTSLQSSVGFSIANRKELTKLVLTQSNIPSAKFVTLKSPADLSLLNELKFPLVIKPSRGDQGKGVQVGVNNAEEIKDYVENYRFTEDDFILGEEMMSGDEFRIICIDYKFYAAAKRKPAFVTGNGISTIAELITEKNAHPWRGAGHKKPLSKIIVDQVVTRNLAEKSYTLDTILEKDEEAFLRKTANLSTGGEPCDLTDEVCEENKQIFETIAKICDLNTIGIDVMCQDLLTPITAQNSAGIIEVNASPGLRMHHFPLIGKPRNAAQAILDLVEKTLQTTA